MLSSPDDIDVVDLVNEQAVLLAKAQASHAHRAAETIFGGDGLRQTMIALLADAELAEHSSPPEATLHVLTGRVVLHGKGRRWELSAGALLPIPPERHSVTAIEDSVFVLSVLRRAS